MLGLPRIGALQSSFRGFFFLDKRRCIWNSVPFSLNQMTEMTNSWITRQEKCLGPLGHSAMPWPLEIKLSQREGRQAVHWLAKASLYWAEIVTLPSLERNESFAFQHMGRFFAFVGEESDGQQKRKILNWVLCSWIKWRERRQTLDLCPSSCFPSYIPRCSNHSI